MREITTHQQNKDDLKIEVVDNHCYRVSGFNTQSNPSDTLTSHYGKPATQAHILFQQGSVGEPNGLTDSALMAIIVDRLESRHTDLLDVGAVGKTLDLARQTLASMLRDQG